MAPKSSIRVRFAPSPTGYLHIGGVRTALYNWLWARQQGGTFILRIEDTDRERSTEPAVAAIIDSMRWLELDWDEGPEVGGEHGPYFQMQRLELYQQYAQKLIDAGGAYRCYCSAEDLQKARAEHKARTGSEQGFRYPGTCRNRKDAPDKPFVVRLRVPDSGVIAWDDLIKGRLEFPIESQQDAVLMRNNGVPLYNLGAVVDDVTMGITLVARADDHVVNTPQQILMFQALGAPLPQFAHMPLILNPSGAKLSKRDAAVAVLDYRDQGYVPDGLLNYLVRLGWSHGDQEIFTRQELIEKFDWEHVGATAGVFNPQKLEWLNQQWIKATPPEQLAQVTGVPAEFVRLMQERARHLNEMRDAWNAYMVPDLPAYDDKAVAKQLTPDTKPLLQEARGVIGAKFGEGAQGMEHAFRTLAEQRGLGLGKVAQPVRVAVTGTTVSPPLFETIVLLGKDRTLRRIDAALEKIR